MEMDFSKEREKKRGFVENELTALLKQINGDVRDVKYFYDEIVRRETVTVKFKGWNNFKKIDVTCDSLSAIAKDVLNIF